MAEVIRADGTRQTVEPANGKSFQFTGKGGAYELIGCDTIQIVSAGDGLIMLIDENGKLTGKPINRAATALYPYGAIDPIVGDVLVCKDSEVR